MIPLKPKTLSPFSGNRRLSTSSLLKSNLTSELSRSSLQLNIVQSLSCCIFAFGLTLLKETLRICLKNSFSFFNYSFFLCAGFALSAVHCLFQDLNIFQLSCSLGLGFDSYSLCHFIFLEYFSSPVNLYFSFVTHHDSIQSYLLKLVSFLKDFVTVCS
jgi:hypothetical protein